MTYIPEKNIVLTMLKFITADIGKDLTGTRVSLKMGGGEKRETESREHSW